MYSVHCYPTGVIIIIVNIFFGICIPFNNIELSHIVNLFLYALRYLFYLEMDY